MRLPRRGSLWALGVTGSILLGQARLPRRAPETKTKAAPLQEYVSPALDAAGTRLRLLHPPGWDVAPGGELRPDARTAAQRASVRYIYVTLAPTPRPNPWRERMLVGHVLPYRAAASKNTGRRPTGAERVVTDSDAAPGQPLVTRYVSYREWLSPGKERLFVAGYHRVNRAAFERTHRAISQSIRLQSEGRRRTP
jgi:hypothetical protein